MPDAFLFDIGNVLITFDYSRVPPRIADWCRVPEAEILPALTPLGPPLERGEISGEDFLKQAAQRIGYDGSADLLRQAFEEIFALNQPMVEFVESIADRSKLHLLSNTNEIHACYFEARYPAFQRFDGRIYSFQAGCMKPDPAIYRYTVEQLGIDPGCTVYIDDLPENCQAGREAGFLTIQYSHRRHQAFLEEIATLLPSSRPR